MTDVNPHDTPLWKLIQSEWMKFDPRINSCNVVEDDILLLVLWALDCMKDEDYDTKLFCRNMWENVYREVRKKYPIRNEGSKADNQLISDVVCAFAIICFGKLIMLSPTHRDIYNLIIKNMGEHWHNVEECMSVIHEDDLEADLREWIYAYMESAVFFTDPDCTWGEKASEEEATDEPLFNPREIRLTLTAGQWVEKWSHKVKIVGEAKTWAHTIEVVRNKWKQATNQKNWEQKETVRQLFFISPDGDWLVDNTSLPYKAFCELVQTKMVSSVTFSNALNNK